MLRHCRPTSLTAEPVLSIILPELSPPTPFLQYQADIVIALGVVKAAHEITSVEADPNVVSKPRAN